MPYTDTPLILSASTYGEAIIISNVSSPGNVIHTTAATDDKIDYLELFCSNAHTADVQVFLRFNGITMELAFIPFKKGLFRLTPPLPFKGGLGGQNVTMWASVGGVIAVVAGAGSSRITIT